MCHINTQCNDGRPQSGSPSVHIDQRNTVRVYFDTPYNSFELPELKLDLDSEDVLLVIHQTRKDITLYAKTTASWQSVSLQATELTKNEFESAFKVDDMGGYWDGQQILCHGASPLGQATRFIWFKSNPQGELILHAGGLLCAANRLREHTREAIAKAEAEAERERLDSQPAIISSRGPCEKDIQLLYRVDSYDPSFKSFAVSNFMDLSKFETEWPNTIPYNPAVEILMIFYNNNRNEDQSMRIKNEIFNNTPDFNTKAQTRHMYGNQFRQHPTMSYIGKPTGHEPKIAEIVNSLRNTCSVIHIVRESSYPYNNQNLADDMRKVKASLLQRAECADTQPIPIVTAAPQPITQRPTQAPTPAPTTLAAATWCQFSTRHQQSTPISDDRLPYVHDTETEFIAKCNDRNERKTPIEPAPANQCMTNHDIRDETFEFLKQTTAYNDKDCQDDCIATYGCTGWVRQPSDGLCWLTSQDTIDFEFENNRNAGRVDCVQPQTTGNDGSNKCMQGHDIKDRTFVSVGGERRASTDAECNLHCVNTDDCTAWSREPRQNGKCWLSQQDPSTISFEPEYNRNAGRVNCN